jgi:hypothetical protein
MEIARIKAYREPWRQRHKVAGVKVKIGSGVEATIQLGFAADGFDRYAPIWVARLQRKANGKVQPTAEWYHEPLLVDPEDPDAELGPPDGAAISIDGYPSMPSHVARLPLAGLGDPSRQRAYRDTSTIVVLRDTTLHERTNLPGDRWGEYIELTDGPVENLWYFGAPPRGPGIACDNPTKIYFDENPELWTVGDCGQCAGCVARAALKLEVENDATFAIRS